MRWNSGALEKDTLLKIVIVLRLSETEAEELMEAGASCLNPVDPRDRVIIALLHIGCYNREDVYDAL